jgi:acetylornithine deacetylase/succinyl-diaminopimelate desuccinylase-like protein
VHSQAQILEEDLTLLLEGEKVTMEEALSRYIQIESLSGNEKEAGEFLKAMCEENGLFITQMGEENGNYNFSASIRPLSDSLPNIIFLNHIDIAPVGDLEEWTYPPFSGEITKKEIWGRGAFDNKGSAIVQLASIVEISKRYEGRGIPHNVTFLAVSFKYANKDMVNALHRLVKKKPKIKFNELNMKVLSQLGDLEKGFTRMVLKHPRLFKPLIAPKLRKHPELLALFANNITVTNLCSGNDMFNIIPSKSTAMLDCRLLPLESRDDFLSGLKKRLKNDAIQVTVVKEMPEMHPSDKKNIYYKYLKQSLSENYPSSYVANVFLPNGSDSGIFRAKGIIVFSVFPIKMDKDYLEYIHTHNERIPRGVLEDGKRVFVRFMEKCMERE